MVEVKPGTEFRLVGEADNVRWRVVSLVGHIEDEEGGYDSWRCEQIAGDATIYEADRNEDRTVDFVGDAIEDYLRSVATPDAGTPS